MIVTLDFETFFSSTFSLTAKAYTTSTYIRDQQFKVHCVAIKLGDKPSKCYSGAAVEKQLRAIDWSNASLVCHNTPFDGAILAWRYGIVPAFYYDTLAMTRALHNEVSRGKLDAVAQFYGLGGKTEGLNATKGLRDLPKDVLADLMTYCNNDNELCYRVFQKQIEVFPKNELELIDLTTRMFTQPQLELDWRRAEEAQAYELRERLVFIHRSGADEATLRSTPRFVKALAELGVVAPRKVSKYTGEVTYALSETDLEFVDLQQHEDERVVRLVQGRLAAKSTIDETRAARLLQISKGWGKVPVLLNYSGAKTHRWSGANKVNMQNLPREEKDGTGAPVPMTGELRKALLAPAKHVVLVCDSAQIEARMLAWISGNTAMVEAFRKNADVYSMLASEVYGFPVDKKRHPNERFVGKVGVLSLGYMAGAARFQATLALGLMGPPIELDMATCKKTVNTFRKTNAAVVRYWQHCERILNDIGRHKSGEDDLLTWDEMSIWLPNGLGLHYPNMTIKYDQHGEVAGYEYLANGKIRHLYGGLVTENITQALARVVVGEQMVWTRDAWRKLKLRKGETAQIVLMTHDEIVSVVPERLAEECLKTQLSIMRRPPEWCADLPLDAEGGYAKNYSK